jgi:hypothetical protein
MVLDILLTFYFAAILYKTYFHFRSSWTNSTNIVGATMLGLLTILHQCTGAANIKKIWEILQMSLVVNFSLCRVGSYWSGAVPIKGHLFTSYFKVGLCKHAIVKLCTLRKLLLPHIQSCTGHSTPALNSHTQSKIVIICESFLSVKLQSSSLSPSKGQHSLWILYVGSWW